MAIEFLKDIGLLRRTMQCNSCGQDMTWTARSDINDGFVWDVGGVLKKVQYVHVHQTRFMVPAE
jgi:uncharacterized protein (DUF983 family)